MFFFRAEINEQLLPSRFAMLVFRNVDVLFFVYDVDVFALSQARCPRAFHGLRVVTVVFLM